MISWIDFVDSLDLEDFKYLQFACRQRVDREGQEFVFDWAGGLVEEEVRYLEGGSKLKAVKHYKERKGVSLKEAADKINGAYNMRKNT